MRQSYCADDLLRNADAGTAERIAEMTPPVSEKVRERIYAQMLTRIGQSDTRETAEFFQVTEVHTRKHWYYAAAACLLFCTGIAGGGFLLSNTESCILSQEGNHTAATEATGLTQTELYSLSMNTLTQLAEQGQVSFCYKVDTRFSSDDTPMTEMNGEAYLDFAQNAHYTALHIELCYPSGIVFRQENSLYSTKDYAIEWTDYERSQGWARFYDADTLSFAGTQVGLAVDHSWLTEQLLSDFSQWEIVAAEEYVCSDSSEVRRSITVSGSCDTFSEICKEASSFRVKLDAETGMWLEMDCFNERGTAIAFLRTSELCFGSEAEPPKQADVIAAQLLTSNYGFEGSIPEAFFRDAEKAGISVPQEFREMHTEQASTGKVIEWHVFHEDATSSSR